MDYLLERVVDKILVNNLQAIESLKKISSNRTFIEVLEMLDKITKNGKIIICGIGKSGYIAQKISSTLCSVGRCSIFLHPSEACHGDLGVIKDNDCIIFISNSGESQEMISVIQYAINHQITSIAITRRSDSYLAKHVNKVLLLENVPEGFLDIKAPSTSTTQTLIIGDIIASYLASIGKITRKEYHQYHPGGKLGKYLSPVSKFMKTGEEIPLVRLSSNFSEALIEIGSKKLGIVVVVDEINHICGLISDGDVRRVLINNPGDISKIKVSDILTKNPKTIHKETTVEDAVRIMIDSKIICLIVEQEKQVIGIVQLYDLQ